MSSKRLYNIFGRQRRLSREDISTYGQTTDDRVKQSIEEQSGGSFEADAMDGWEALSYDTTVMKGLDKKFIPKSNVGLYFIASTLVVIIGGLFLWNYTTSPTTSILPDSPGDEKITSLMEDQEITLDESDLIIPDTIQQMQDAPMKEQVKIESIKDDFKEMQTIQRTESPIQITILPAPEIETEPLVKELAKEHFRAKEIYLHDLKLVDYRKYRSKPTVKTKQMVLTGTPANMEGDQSETFESDWKDVDIPYIDYLDKSVQIFARGNYKRALTRFETIIESYPDDVNANFYAGLCLYNLGEYSNAIETFNKCINGSYSNFDEEGQWFIAMSYLKLNNKVQARRYFETIEAQDGFYAKQATKKLKKLGR